MISCILLPIVQSSLPCHFIPPHSLTPTNSELQPQAHNHHPTLPSHHPPPISQDVAQSLHKSASPTHRDPSLNSTSRLLFHNQRSQNALWRPASTHSHPPNHASRKHHSPPAHFIPHNTTLPHPATPALALPEPSTTLPIPRYNPARPHRSMDALHHTLHSQFNPHLHIHSFKTRLGNQHLHNLAIPTRDAKAHRRHHRRNQRLVRHRERRV
jgi:hypothetical protein